MGLDAVELVMEIEDHFKMSIPDEDAERIQTAGQLLKYVCARRPGLVPRLDGRCPSQHAFYEVRQRLMSASGCDRQAVRPTVRLGRLIAARNRRAVWPELTNRLGFRPVPLRPGPALTLGIVLLACIAGFSAIFRWEHGIAVLVPPVAMVILYFLVQPWAVWLSAGGPTIGDLSLQWLLRHRNHLEPVPQETEAIVWEQIVTIISEQAGIDRREITKRTHFINDLNFG